MGDFELEKEKEGKHILNIFLYNWPMENLRQN
jgi:hypothetical protein